MVSDRTIANCIEEVTSISQVAMAVTDSVGEKIASTGGAKYPSKDEVKAFLDGKDEWSVISGRVFVRVVSGDEDTLVLVADEDEKGVCARLAAMQLGNIVSTGNDSLDRNSFFQNILLDNMLPVDIYNKAAKLHIEAAAKRCVFIIEPVIEKENNLIEMVRELFYSEAGDHVTAVDENHVVVIKALDANEGKDELSETADMLVDMAGSEALSDVRVSYGCITDDIKGISRSYKEAKMALEVGRIFYPLKRTMEYENLGVGRLIYQLPVNLCRLFVREIFGDDIPEEIDEEVLTTVNRFFENNLNVSETSRQLFIHRNTLMYRIEKLQKATGLDVRVFDDALTLKIALMVVNYMRYAEENGM